MYFDRQQLFLLESPCFYFESLKLKPSFKYRVSSNVHRNFQSKELKIFHRQLVAEGENEFFQIEYPIVSLTM